MAEAVNKEARIVNGLGSALAVIGWIGFVSVVVLEILMIVNLFDVGEPLWSELQAFAVVEILWVGMLALAGFGHALRLFAAYARDRTAV